MLFARALEDQDLLGPDGLPLRNEDEDGPILVAWSDNGSEMKSIDTRQFMALMAIAQHHGRPGTPTDQAHVESFLQPSEGRLAAPDRHHRSGRARHRARPDPHRVQHGSPPRLDRVRHPPTTNTTAAGRRSGAPAPPGSSAPAPSGSSRIEPARHDPAHRHQQRPAPPREEGRF